MHIRLDGTYASARAVQLWQSTIMLYKKIAYNYENGTVFNVKLKFNHSGQYQLHIGTAKPPACVLSHFALFAGSDTNSNARHPHEYSMKRLSINNFYRTILDAVL